MTDSYEDFIGSYTNADMLLIAAPTLRQLVFNTTHTRYYFWNGSNWQGLPIHFTDQTQVGTDADLLEKVLVSRTLTGGLLTKTGSMLIIHATGQFAANNNSKILTFDFGSSTHGITWTGTDANSKYWFALFKIIRTGAATQVITGYWIAMPRTGSVAAPLSMGTKLAGGETMASDITVQITGQNGVAAANDILFDEWSWIIL